MVNHTAKGNNKYHMSASSQAESPRHFGGHVQAKNGKLEHFEYVVSFLTVLSQRQIALE